MYSRTAACTSARRQRARSGTPAIDKQTQNQFLLETLEQAMEAVVMVDREGYITFFNQAAREMFGYARRDAVGHDVATLLQATSDDADDEFWLDPSQGSHYRGEARFMRYDGRAILCSYSVSRVTIGSDTVITAFLQDITRQRESEDQINFHANHDGLTGLANRRRFRRELQDLFAQPAEQSDALALIDMDNFKGVNDLLGHGAGDRFLEATARRLAHSVRGTDVVYRLGGDEFAIILRGVSGQSAAVSVMSRVAGELQQTMVVDDVQWSPTASIGIACTGRSQCAEDLLRNADLAMYEAKSLGKGRVVFYDEALSRRTRNRIVVQKQLEAALANGNVIAHFQPIVDLDSGRTTSLEALVRWVEDDGRVIPPAEFVPVAEATDLILEVETAVMDHALSTLAEMRTLYPGLTMNLNISPRHFAHDDLVPSVFDLLAKYEVPAQAVTLELTESILLNESTLVSDQFRRLRELGVRVALDDFGTGYSSLSYLDKYRFDILKIDRSFVTDLENAEVRRRLVEIIVAVGRVMDMDVIAEGIETRSDREIVQSLGCKLGQGFLMAKPMSRDDVRTHLRAQGEQPETGSLEQAQSA
ncbi:MAG: EAL domain-containing protein [Pseudomonadota bacterium]